MGSRFLILLNVYFAHLRDEFWLARDMNTGQTWRDFTQERGFTVEDIEAGRSWARYLDKKIAEGTYKPVGPWMYGYT